MRDLLIEHKHFTNKAATRSAHDAIRSLASKLNLVYPVTDSSFRLPMPPNIGPTSQLERTIPASYRHYALHGRNIRSAARALERAAKEANAGDDFSDFCHTYQSSVTSDAPDTANPELFDIDTQSITYDLSDWRPVRSNNDIRQTPFERMYAFRVRRKNESPNFFAPELDSSGFGAFPLAQFMTDPPPMGRVWVNPNKTMPEAKGYTRAIYPEYRLSHTDARTNIFCPSVFYNGTQDQIHRKSPHDWLGFRVRPTAKVIDMTIIPPKSVRMVEPQFFRRVDQAGSPNIAVDARHVDLNEPEREKLIGFTHDPSLGLSCSLPPVDVVTVFSFRWEWNPSDLSP